MYISMTTIASSNSERHGRDNRCAHRVRSAAIAALILPLTLGILRTAAADVSVSPSVAGLFVGEEKIVEGTVIAAERETNVVHLQLGKAPQQMLVSLVMGLLNSFPAAPEDYYRGKTIRVSGVIRSFRGTPEMIIHDPADIQIVGSASAISGSPSGNTVSAGTNGDAAERAGREAVLQRQVEGLTDQVHRLEQRIQQLETGTHP